MLAALSACEWQPATQGLNETPEFAGITEEPAIMPAWGDADHALTAQLDGMDGRDHGAVTFLPEQEGEVLARVSIHNLEPRNDYFVAVHLDSRCGDDFQDAGDAHWLLMEPAPRVTVSGTTRPEMDEPRFVQPDPDGSLTMALRLPLSPSEIEDHTLVVTRVSDGARIACGVIDPSA
jgi:hypothetical protein